MAKDGKEPDWTSKSPFRPLTKRQQEIADAHIADPTKPQSEIAKEFGTTQPQVSKTLNLPHVKVHIESMLDAAGATVRKSAEVIAHAHKAMDTKLVTHKGVLTKAVSLVDHQTRLRAAELNLEVRGYLDKGSKQSMNVFMSLSDEQLALIAVGQLDPSTLFPPPGGHAGP